MDIGRKKLCPGYFSREDVKILELDPTKFKDLTCALYGRRVDATNKSGEWVPRNHAVDLNPLDN